ncbi:S8 family serine peptidase [Clostridium omnivorum]|uniref:Peptidase S8/S53 domain-containing protein n=1 Tax=Clostridium omnivorum TaxID=1604902 RepID=A0ABQ5N7V3_9CLOT|nr:S8 family serine peptidase [Clostridium sp. E14]GLC31317.1 hypothetical protein bsdE14_27270 [Clostridium sp. E14]
MKRGFIGVIILSLLLTCSCTQKAKTADVKQSDSKVELGIVRHPPAASYSRGKMTGLPSFNPNSEDNWQVDLRSYDISDLSLADRLKDLKYADFDSKTVWPKNLPKEFDKDKIMELGKNPGLGIRELHSKGITGKGVGVAIIDQQLLVDHTEYKDRLRYYDEIHIDNGTPAQMHGPAVASIAVGKNVGVAPEADLYYIAETHGDFKDGGFDWDFTWLAKSIDRILEVNKSLENDKKIRVISISVGWSKEQKGYKEVTEAVKRAKKEGILVVSSSIHETYKFNFQGLGRDILNDPESPSSYEPGIFWKNEYLKKPDLLKTSDYLLIPMDSRTVASPTGEEDYVFYRNGGWSWSIPYISGLYALACQVNPDITPEKFWEAALSTGDIIDYKNDNKTYKFGTIVNPKKLMDKIEKK